MNSDRNTRPSDRVKVDEPQDFEFDCALMSLGKLPVVLCIGSDRVTGDCLGPLVGQILVERGANAFVYGTLRRPVTALNLKDAVEHIHRAHGERKVLAVDSSVGKASDVGKIRIAFGAIAPGSADGKVLPKVGDVSITATVTDPNKTPLAAVRLGIVYELANDIAERIIRGLQ
ncbi:MAG: spore protease YyaC [Clostridiales bacterium]|nr:spore protease YyaC [Clostridiales bacterium]